MQLNPGTLIKGKQNEYTIVSVLGHGTFGITYKATVSAGRLNGRTVTIKEFFINGISSREESGLVSSCSDTVAVARCQAEFVAEAENLILLNHPNIVKAYEVFEANGTVYYSMEYIEGENLNMYLNRVHLTTDEAVSIITKIAYGLSYMHESRHMLHLDLKPGNVMRRSADGQIILIDFGLSRYFNDEGTPELAAPVGLGTVGYAPVEQTEQNRGGKDFKASIDVYALGATFYKLLTGQTPPPARQLMDSPGLLHQKLLGIDLPDQKRQIVERAMSPQPADRYQSVMAFIYDLNADERKRRKRGCLLSVLSVVVIIAITSLVVTIVKWQNNAIQRYYDHLDGYAFEMTDFNQGANHYGEREYYKIFPDGTGFYMFQSWHDATDCNDPGCDLESRTDTMTFRYRVEGNDRIVFEKGIDSFLGGMLSIHIDIPNHQVEIDHQDDNPTLYINPETINWDEVMKIGQ